MPDTESERPDLEVTEMSRKWLLAMAGILPVVLQSVTYLCYKSFFALFHVRPEEVGYDFASLLGQQAAALIIAFAMALAVAATCAFVIGYVGYFLAPAMIRRIRFPGSVKTRFPFVSRLEGVYSDGAMIVFAAVALFSWLLVTHLAGGVFAVVHIPFMGLLLALDHIAYKKGGWRSKSVWMRLTESESYSVTRLLILVAAVTFALSESPGEGIDRINISVTLVAVVFMFDRAILKPRPQELPRSLGGRVRLPIAITTAALTGVALMVTLGGIDKIMLHGGIEHAVRATQSGVGYVNQPFNWKSLVVPDTRPVAVEWINTSDQANPAVFAERSTVDAVLLGQANGTTVVWWAKKKQVLRLPSNAVIVSSRDTGSPLSGL